MLSKAEQAAVDAADIATANAVKVAGEVGIPHEQVMDALDALDAADLAKSPEELESVQETLFWLSQPGILESITEAKTDADAGRVYTEDQIRAEIASRNLSR